MVRAPCCDKMGLKKGPWTPEEDQILVSYIKRFGHGNWRALPKQAGLLRCGKSCRLRWINYLRPDIKRGNFSCEEEETIVRLHQIIGNRWSAIAERLPGRTDNEIKNYWHSRLKKRFQQHLATPTAGISSGQGMKAPTSGNAGIINGRTSQPINHISDHQKRQNLGLPSASSQESSSQESLCSVTTMEAATDFDGGNDMKFWYDLFMGSSKLDRTLNFL